MILFFWQIQRTIAGITDEIPLREHISAFHGLRFVASSPTRWENNIRRTARLDSHQPDRTSLRVQLGTSHPAPQFQRRADQRHRNSFNYPPAALHGLFELRFLPSNAETSPVQCPNPIFYSAAPNHLPAARLQRTRLTRMRHLRAPPRPSLAARFERGGDHSGGYPDTRRGDVSHSAPSAVRRRPQMARRAGAEPSRGPETQRSVACPAAGSSRRTGRVTPSRAVFGPVRL